MNKYTLVLTGKRQEELNAKLRCIGVGNKDKVNEMIFNFGEKGKDKCQGIDIVLKAFKHDGNRLDELKVNKEDTYAYIDIDEGELPCLMNELTIFAYAPKKAKSFSNYSWLELKLFKNNELLHEQTLHSLKCRVAKLVTLSIPDVSSSVQLNIGVTPGNINDIKIGRNT